MQDRYIVKDIKNDTSMSITENYAQNGHSGSEVIRRRSYMSENYIVGLDQSGSEYRINPTAVSASDGDNVLFIYRSGLAGPPKRF